MKKTLHLIFASVIVFLIFSGCQDRTDLTGPSPANGKVDFTRLVSLGNSLTAGYQSGALYADAQLYAYDAQIAKEVNANYATPTISYPGIGGLMYIKSIDLSKGTIVIGVNPSTGTPTNTGYKAPYNNLGVPGAILNDILNTTSSTTNPFFNIVLRGLGTEYSQAKALQPTFLTLWIGNNDILGYATSGGTTPYTPSAMFTSMFNTLGDSIASLGCKVAIANIPDVTSIPFFTTVGPKIAQEVPWTALKSFGVQGLVYQSTSSPIGVNVADSAALITGKVLITLPGSNYAPLIGKSTGQYYRDNHLSIPLGVDTTQAFGFDPRNPWPDALILDENEINTAKTSTADFNSAIAGVVSKYPNQFVLVDINKFFNSLRANDFTGGTVFNGVRFFTSYITGGLFSLDGIHPTSEGQAVIANQFLAAINAKFGSNFPMIDIASVPGSLILAKQAYEQSHKLPYFEPGTFDHILY